MVTTTDLSQLSQECSSWRESLRSSREKFTLLKQQLPQQARFPRDKEDLLQVDHFDNQFHIQLINIHDLKQAVKHHERMLQVERHASGGHVSDATVSDHESLHNAFESLQATLEELQEEFQVFCRRD